MKIRMNLNSFQVSYMIVDDMFQIGHPDLLKDTYWNQVVPAALPYTADTIHYRSIFIRPHFWVV